MHPEAGAVDRLAEAGRERQEEEHDRADAEEVLVALERAVVAGAAQKSARAKTPTADHDPEPLLERVPRAEPVDLGQADRRQEARDRQQVRVGVRHGDPRDDVGGEVEAEEEGRVGERAARDLRLAARCRRWRSRSRSARRRRRALSELAVAVRGLSATAPRASSATASASSASSEQREPQARRVSIGSRRRPRAPRLGRARPSSRSRPHDHVSSVVGTTIALVERVLVRARPRSAAPRAVEPATRHAASCPRRRGRGDREGDGGDVVLAAAPVRGLPRAALRARSRSSRWRSRARGSPRPRPCR